MGDSRVQWARWKRRHAANTEGNARFLSVVGALYAQRRKDNKRVTWSGGTRGTTSSYRAHSSCLVPVAHVRHEAQTLSDASAQRQKKREDRPGGRLVTSAARDRGRCAAFGTRPPFVCAASSFIPAVGREQIRNKGRGRKRSRSSSARSLAHVYAAGGRKKLITTREDVAHYPNRRSRLGDNAQSLKRSCDLRSFPCPRPYFTTTNAEKRGKVK